MAPGGRLATLLRRRADMVGLAWKKEGWAEERVSGELVALCNDLMQVWPEVWQGRGREERQRAPSEVSVWKQYCPNLQLPPLVSRIFIFHKIPFKLYFHPSFKLCFSLHPVYLVILDEQHSQITLFFQLPFCSLSFHLQKSSSIADRLPCP